jgi:tetratricopeptide (TPR) repeat protein
MDNSLANWTRLTTLVEKRLIPSASMRVVYIALLLSGTLASGAVSPGAIQQAEQELFAARYDRAAELYVTLVHDDPTWAPGYYGAVRALIGAYRAHEAYSTAEEGLRRAPETAEVQSAAGLAAYRGGDLIKAEGYFHRALEINPKSAPGLSGLALIYYSISKLKSARTLMITAYHASSGDPQLIMAWANSLEGDMHIAALQKVLGIYDPGSREARALRAYIARDRGAGKRELRRLITPYQSHQIKLVPISRGPGRPYGVGLHAQLNKTHTVQLMLDTGSSGISISPKAAEKAGLEVLTGGNWEARGLGSQKPQETLAYLASEIAVGDLQLADFPVEAFQTAKTSDYDGLIGADVFQRFLVSVDFKEMRLTLDAYPEEPRANAPEDAADTLSPGFFRAFRIGNSFSVHTSVNQGPLQLFVIDSGSSANLIDTDMARESTKVHDDNRTVFRGIQGRADKVARASQVSLAFAGFRQDNPDLLATSLEALDDVSGVGIAGLLGMPVLRLMKLTIDYRNGAVRFEYKPK